MHSRDITILIALLLFNIVRYSNTFYWFTRYCIWICSGPYSRWKFKIPIFRIHCTSKMDVLYVTCTCSWCVTYFTFNCCGRPFKNILLTNCSHCTDHVLHHISIVLKFHFVFITLPLIWYRTAIIATFQIHCTKRKNDTCSNSNHYSNKVHVRL